MLKFQRHILTPVPFPTQVVSLRRALKLATKKARPILAVMHRLKGMPNNVGGLWFGAATVVVGVVRSSELVPPPEPTPPEDLLASRGRRGRRAVATFDHRGIG
jgi:hypothetical protein